MEVVLMDLRLCYLFTGLTEEQLDRIFSTVSEVPMVKDELIFTGGNEALGLHVLKDGAVELIMESENELEIPIAILREPGECFGTSALMPDHSYSLSSRCVRDGSFLFVDRSLLHRIISEDRDLGCILMTNAAGFFLDRLNQARQELRIHFSTLFKLFYL
jgi:CRP-like cAMP-binding protein